MPPTTCATQVHAAMQRCAALPRGSREREECLLSHGLRAQPWRADECPRDATPRTCHIAGDSQPLYACLPGGGGESQDVYGLALFGSTSRLTAAAKSP